jgi:hypothetical protein
VAGKTGKVFRIMLLSEQTGEFPPVQIYHCLDCQYLPSSPARAPGFLLRLMEKRTGVPWILTMLIVSEGKQSSAGKSRIKPGAFLTPQTGCVLPTIEKLARCETDHEARTATPSNFHMEAPGARVADPTAINAASPSGWNNVSPFGV